MSKGEFLKKAREEKGIALETVHEATKIPMDALRAIEEGYKVRTLSSFYYRSFTKMYAQFLDVEIRDVPDDTQQQDEKKPEPVTPKPTPKPTASLKKKQEDIQISFDKFLTKQRKKQIVQVLAILLAVFLLWKFMTAVAGWIADRRNRAKTAETESVQEAKPVDPNPVLDAEDIPDDPVAPPAQAVPEGTPQANVSNVIPVRKDVVLSVRAKRNSWLQVKSDGEVVFQSTLKSGVSETWYADEKIEILGGNIGYLEFELNGRMIGTLSRSDRSAKKVIITENGLSVEK